MAVQFQKATKKQLKARIALAGPSGSGKTKSALRIAQGLGGKIAVIDTEHRSASKYADEHEFDVLELDAPFHPDRYVEAIRAAKDAGYEILIIDSLSHAWAGDGGVLDVVNKATLASRSKNSYTEGWSKGTPLQNRLVETLIRADMHVIATMRSKQEYALDKDDKGRTEVKKLGLAPIQRDGVEYEFDIVGSLDVGHNLVIEKTRFAAIDGEVITKPGEEFGKRIAAWLDEGEAVPAAVASRVVATQDTTGPEVDDSVTVTLEDLRTAREAADLSTTVVRDKMTELFGNVPAKSLSSQQIQQVIDWIKKGEG